MFLFFSRRRRRVLRRGPSRGTFRRFNVLRRYQLSRRLRRYFHAYGTFKRRRREGYFRTCSESSLARPRQTPPARRCARISAPRPRGPPSRVACGAPSRPRRAEAGREAAVPPESIRETPPPGARARAASVVRSRGPRTARRALLRGGPPSGTTRRSSCPFPAETRARPRRNDASP